MRAVLSKAVLSRLAASGAALLAGATTLLAGPLPAYAETVFIEVNPSTIMAGFPVSIRASCGGAVNPAKATSEAFGTVTLVADKNLLIGTVTVPAKKPPRGYPVRLNCPTGGRATATLWVISQTSRPTRGPNTGGGFLAHQGGPGETLMIASGLAAAGAGGVLAVWAAARRRRAGEL